MATSVSSLEGSVAVTREEPMTVDRLFKYFTHKCLQVIVQSRIQHEEPAPASSKDLSPNFCVTIPDIPFTLEEQIRKLFEGIKLFPVKDRSICVEVSLVTSDGDHMFLETWDMSFNVSSLDIAASKLQNIYARMCVTIKSILIATRAMPAYRLAKNQGEKGGGYRLNYRFYLGKPQTHLLGEGFKTVRAGSVPTAHGLLSINTSFRTKLLLSPEMSASSVAAIEVTDNYFVQEPLVAASPPKVTQPQPCSSPRESQITKEESPHGIAASPPALEKKDEVQTKVVKNPVPWGQSSILDVEEFPQPRWMPFSVAKPSLQKFDDHDVPFDGLMRRSMLATQELLGNTQQRLESPLSGTCKGEKEKTILKEEEKENVPVSKVDPLRGQNMSVEEEYVMVDKPFALDDDPRDVKAFLGVMFRAPNLYETPDFKVSVDDYLSDVEALVSRLENDMPVLDEFCQSVINLSGEEEEEEDTLFS